MLREARMDFLLKEQGLGRQTQRCAYETTEI